MEYEAVIGLETHVQLKTKSKIWCGCANEFGAPPNTNVCPVCLGLPGTLPVLNKRAVEMAIALGGTSRIDSPESTAGPHACPFKGFSKAAGKPAPRHGAGSDLTGSPRFSLSGQAWSAIRPCRDQDSSITRCGLSWSFAGLK